MSDEEFVADLKACRYPAGSFHHADHLRLGWIFLSHMPLERALREVAVRIQTFVRHHGKASLYHDTITKGWLRLLASHEESEFHDFLRANSSRLSANLLLQHWSEELLMSAGARNEWIAPNLQPLPGASARFLSVGP